MMKKFLMLVSIASTVCATEESVIPAGAVQCGKGRYRFEPYDQNIIQTPGAAQNPQHSTSHVGLEPPSYAASLFPENHPLFSTLVQGKHPGTMSITEIKDLSIFQLTAEMALVPYVLENYKEHILPQLSDFVDRDSRWIHLQNKQIEVRKAIANFYSLTQQHQKYAGMIMRISCIHGEQRQNEAAFHHLDELMKYLKDKELDNGKRSNLHKQIFLMMVKYIAHMQHTIKHEYWSKLDAYTNLFEQYYDIPFQSDVQQRALNEYEQWRQGVPARIQ